MKVFAVSASCTFDINLVRTFKTPMLCDITKVHKGFGPIPQALPASDDVLWGKVGQSKKIHFRRSLIFPSGLVLTDTILDRVENKLWRIQVDEFQSWSAGFTKFIGEWHTESITENHTKVTYSYYLRANKAIYYPLNWLFAQCIWRPYMKRLLRNIKGLAEKREPYLHE